MKGEGERYNKLPCPICNSPTWVYFTERIQDMVKRRRRCNNGHRFNTREIFAGIVDSPVARSAIDSESDIRYDGSETELKRLLEI